MKNTLIVVEMWTEAFQSLIFYQEYDFLRVFLPEVSLPLSNFLTSGIPSVHLELISILKKIVSFLCPRWLPCSSHCADLEQFKWFLYQFHRSRLRIDQFHSVFHYLSECCVLWLLLSFRYSSTYTIFSLLSDRDLLFQVLYLHMIRIYEADG